MTRFHEAVREMSKIVVAAKYKGYLGMHHRARYAVTMVIALVSLPRECPDTLERVSRKNLVGVNGTEESFRL